MTSSHTEVRIHVTEHNDVIHVHAQIGERKVVEAHGPAHCRESFLRIVLDALSQDRPLVLGAPT